MCRLFSGCSACHWRTSRKKRATPVSFNKVFSSLHDGSIVWLLTKLFYCTCSLLQHLKRREKKIRDDIEATAGVQSTSAQQEKSKDSSVREGHVVDGKWVGSVQIDIDDVEYLLEIWRNRCAVTGDRLGTVLELARWDLTRPSTCNNLVLMGAGALHKFDAEGVSSVPESVQQKIEARLDSCRVDANAY